MNRSAEFQYPPSIQKAQIHRKAHQMFRLMDVNEFRKNVCDCCQKCIGEESEEAKLCFHPTETLSFLGPGGPLLFLFMQNSLILLIVVIAILAIYNLVSNLLSHGCDQPELSCDFFGRSSIPNKLQNPESIAVQVYLNFIFSFVFMLLHTWFIYRMRKLEWQIDEQNQTPSDFAIMIQQLPENTTEQDINLFIEQRRRQLNEEQRSETQNLKIEKILIPKNKQKLLIYQAYQIIKFKKMIKQGKQNQFKINKLQEQKIQKSLRNSNIAIITFAKEKSKQFFIQNLSITQKIKNIFCNTCIDISTKYRIKNHPIAITRAPQPQDINWKNIGKPKNYLLLKRIASNLFSIALVLLGGAAQYGFAISQRNITIEPQRSILQIFSVVILSLTNYIISTFLIWASSIEDNITFSKQNKSLNIKICIFQFCNAGVFYFISNLLAILDEPQGLKQFSFKVTIFMTINAFVPTIIQLFVDYAQIPQCFQRILIQKNFRVYTQSEANKAYEMPACEIPFKYAYVMKNVLLTCFYLPIVPLVSFISLIGLFVYYWVMKGLFRSCYSIPGRYSSEINSVILYLSSFTPLVILLGQLVIRQFMVEKMHQHEQKQAAILYFLAIAFSILIIILPWQSINQYFFKFKIQKNQSYSKFGGQFEMTYEMFDPLFKGQRIWKNDFMRLKIQTKFSFPQMIKKLTMLPSTAGKLLDTMDTNRMLWSSPNF